MFSTVSMITQKVNYPIRCPLTQGILEFLSIVLLGDMEDFYFFFFSQYLQYVNNNVNERNQAFLYHARLDW